MIGCCLLNPSDKQGWESSDTQLRILQLAQSPCPSRTVSVHVDSPGPPAGQGKARSCPYFQMWKLRHKRLGDLARPQRQDTVGLGLIFSSVQEQLPPPPPDCV